MVQAQVWEAGQAARLELQVPLNGFHQEEINDADLKENGIIVLIWNDIFIVFFYLVQIVMVYNKH